MTHIHDPNQIQWERDAYKGLVGVNSAINSVTEFDELLITVMDIAKSVMDAEIASLFLADELTGDLLLKIASMEGSDHTTLKELRIPKGQGVSGWCYENQKPVLVRDASQDPRFYKQADKKSGLTTRSLLTAPLISYNKCIGVLQVLNPRQTQCFEEYQLPPFEAYAGMAATAIEKIRLQQAEAQKLKTEQELTIASEIQKNFLPESLEFEGFEIGTSYAPARSVGGDLYDFFQLSENKYAFFIGDVSGKGVPAALYMAQTISQIRLLSKRHSSPGEVLKFLNESFCEKTMRGMFVTVLLGFYDAGTGHVLLANAGHHAPYLVTEQGVSHLEVEGGAPIGIIPELEYSDIDVLLAPHSMILLYTDGLVEMRNPEKEEFGELRIESILKECGPQAKTVAGKLNDQLQAFKGTAPAHDDLTILAVTFLNRMNNESRLSIPSTPSEFCKMRAFIRENLVGMPFDDITANQIVLAVDEAITNIYRYAYFEKEGQPIDVFFVRLDGILEIRLVDQGVCCELSKIKSRDLDDVRPGGLGVYLMQSVMNTVEFRPHPEGRGTTLILRKNIPSDKA